MPDLYPGHFGVVRKVVAMFPTEALKVVDGEPKAKSVSP